MTLPLGAPFLYLPHCIASSVIVFVGVLVFGFICRLLLIIFIV